MKKIRVYSLLYFALILYSMTSIASKLASNAPFLSFPYIFYLGLEFLILAVYAVLWQMVLKEIPLFIAYANKGMTIFLGMIIGYFMFGEKVTMFNIIGTGIIAVGIITMMMEDLKR